MEKSIKYTKRSGRFVVWFAAVGVLAGAGVSHGALIFSDTFGGSSATYLNPTSYPAVTSTATGYDIASTKNATSSYGPGDLKIAMATTTSGVVEGQARVPSTWLGGTGDFVEMTVNFNNGTATTGGLLAGGTSSVIYFGLYNSASSAPVSGLQTSGLNTTSTTFATGGTQLWQGYIQQIALTGGANRTATRPQQNGVANATNAHQDLVGNGAGGGLYNDPAGATIGGNTTSTTAALVNGNPYTADVLITRNADGSQTITTNLYDGTGTGGTNLATFAKTTGTTPITTVYDAISFGLRQSGTTTPTQMDITAININAVSTPEPASIVGLCAVGGLVLRRRRA